MALFVNKQKKVQTEVSRYCSQVANCLDTFQHALEQYCKNPDRDAIRKDVADVHKAESLADDIRRDIEVLMYSKALFPESRGDILGLLETMDKVPNQAESTVRMIMNQHIVIPETYCQKVLQLVDVGCRAGKAMIEAAEKLFTDYTNATVAIGKIDELESEGDRIDAELIERLFSDDDIDGFDKIILRDLVKQISQISDRAENVGDRIRIIVAKRGI
ncbi:MAG: DUF47 family protein [Phycisphaerae bacterium]|nr:DUF47 family protein [Phycisphaerae bacterium]